MPYCGYTTTKFPPLIEPYKAVIDAVPVPVPGPVATKETPTVFDAAPISVKFVVPTEVIIYVSPVEKDPALALGRVTVYVFAST
jgi:hypothetical protein